MKCQIPCGIPWIFPLVWHRDDIKVLQVCPTVVSSFFPFLWRLVASRISLQPAANIVIVKLFGPEQSCISLTLDGLVFHLGDGLLHALVEFLRFCFALRHDLRNGSDGLFFGLVLHSQLNLGLSAGRDSQFVDSCGFCAGLVVV